MRQDATLRKLEVIGQAVKNLSEEAKTRQPQIPWKQIAGMKDKVIHDYFGVNSISCGPSLRRNCRDLRLQLRRFFRLLNRSESIQVYKPPLTFKTVPVIYPACSEARNTAANATSSGVPSRFSAIRPSSVVRASSARALVIAV